MKCRNCKKSQLKKIVNVGSQPLSGIFYKSKQKKLKKFPLNLYFCKNCRLVQLLKTANKNLMFGKFYEYRTSLSNLMVSHLEKKIKYLKDKKYINNSSSVLDIGSNDGTFLNSLKCDILCGVDPTAYKFKDHYKKNIYIINNFFSKKSIENFFLKRKPNINCFDLVTSFAMFYDVDDPNSFCKDIYSLLKSNGVWMLELSYLPLMLKNLTYDQICHEHINYYTLSVFKKIAEKNKLKIVDVGLNEINGGSIEIVCARVESKIEARHGKIKKLLNDERKINLNSFKNFNKRINYTKKSIINFINKNSDKEIIGYGASTKGNVVLNHCKINNIQIKKICDGNKKKIGSYTPGTNIKIISKRQMRKEKPDYLWVLIWSFRKEVIQQELAFLKQGGKLVFHLPKFHIVDIFNYKSFLKKNFKKLAYNY